MQSQGLESLELIEKAGLEGSSDYTVQNCHILVSEMGVGGFIRTKIILDAAFSMDYALFFPLCPPRKINLVLLGVLSAR
jgi:hypothetical protein